MKVVILHNNISEKPTNDEQDTIVQVEAVSKALSYLGFDQSILPFSLNLHQTKEGLNIIKPDIVFNLVESVENYDRLIHLSPSILDCLNLPYTGSKTETLFLTSNKVISKKILQSSQLPTPDYIPLKKKQDKWITIENRPVLDNGPTIDKARAYIIKSVWEHASIGLDEDSILIPDDIHHLQIEMEARKEGLGGDCFAEVYIDGREFNLSLLAYENQVQVLPPAEIIFNHYPDQKRKIVDYKAKWEEDSFEYTHTNRSFDFYDHDKHLIQHLIDLGKKCWDLFELRGYARIDFRVDQSGQPWILEVNANPCLSEDSGFVAAARQSSLSFPQVIERIIQASLISYRFSDKL